VYSPGKKVLCKNKVSPAQTGLLLITEGFAGTSDTATFTKASVEEHPVLETVNL
jgi:hypothetical protein